MSITWQKKAIRLGSSLGLLFGVLAFASTARAQEHQIRGLIVARSGATMTVKTPDSEDIVVALTDDTRVEEEHGLLKLGRKQQAVTALIPGLPVQVKGSENDQHQLVAETVKFKGSDLKVAIDIQAGVNPTQEQLEANQAKTQENSQQIAASQADIAANQADIVAANKRFGQLGEYNILGEVTVYFANGKATLDPKYEPDLLSLAQKAQIINAYIIQVQGYASAVGSAALNQKLSAERADSVLSFLEQQGKIPLTNVLAPGAMGTTDQVGSNSTAEGQAENRRVVVRILQNKGIAGN
jgi:OmpA-OmpF porin, OOP family